jgi:prepilin-type N-terminal cleavage/methylation domain-containing protein
MKTPKAKKHPAFTLLEMMITTAIVAIAGGGIFLALVTGLNLYAKNLSVNSTHQQMLKAINRVTRDIHASVSIPKLLNSNLSAATGSGPAAGISLQVIKAGPFAQTNGANRGTSLLTLQTGTAYRPKVGQRVIHEDLALEEDITAVAVNGANSSRTDVTIATPLSLYAFRGMAFIAERIAYVVVNGELRFYPRASDATTWFVIARGVTPSTATPFSLAINSSGVWNNPVVIGALTTSDPTYNKRGYRAVDMSMSFRVPYRTRIAVYQ